MLNSLAQVRHGSRFLRAVSEVFGRWKASGAADGAQRQARREMVIHLKVIFGARRHGQPRTVKKRGGSEMHPLAANSVVGELLKTKFPKTSVVPVCGAPAVPSHCSSDTFPL